MTNNATSAGRGQPARTRRALAPQHRRPRLDPDSAAIRRAVADSLPQEPAHFAAAVSGGPDSLALAAACAHLERTTEHRFTAVVIDHGLQPGSAHTAARAAGTVLSMGLPAVVRAVRVERTAQGLEADARTARYSALEDVRRELGALAVLTGHTRDDQAETVLLGLLRGSGVRAVSGMRPRSGAVWRPLLGIERRQTLRSAWAQRIPVWHDPMNSDGDFARVRVRSAVLGALTDELGEGIRGNLARTAELASFDADYLDERAELIGASLVSGARASAQTAGLPAALGTRVLRDWLRRELGRSDIGAEHVLGAWRALGGGPQPLSMPGGAELIRADDGDLVLRYPGQRPR